MNEPQPPSGILGLPVSQFSHGGWYCKSNARDQSAPIHEVEFFLLWKNNNPAARAMSKRAAQCEQTAWGIER
jgi:hypothetical protein